MRKLYRVYYSTFNDEVHRRVVEELSKRLGVRVIDYTSRVAPGFRFLEVLLDKPGREEEIKSIVASIIGNPRVKVDWIDTSR